MRLARKIVSVLLVCFVGAFATYSVLRFRWAIQTFEQGLHTDHHLLGLALGAAYTGAWRNGGEHEASAMLASANRQEEVIRVRWKPLDPVAAADPAATLPDGVREAARRGEETSRTLADPGGQRRLFTWVPVNLDESRRGVLELSQSLTALQEYERRTGMAAAATAGGLALLCGLVTVLLGVRWIGRPMAALAEKARRVGEGDLSGPITLRQSDEIADLANELNRMCERLAEARDLAAAEASGKLAAVEQLRHASRLATVGRLASGLAHEMGTPLNVVSARAKMIASGEVTGAEAAEDSRIIAQQAEKMTRLIRQVLDIARGPSPNPQKTTVDVTAIVRQTLEVLKPLAEKQGVSLLMCDTRAESVQASGPQIEQALTNLVVNGIQASLKGTTIRVELARDHVHPPPEHGGPKGEFLRVSVRDEGSGMTEEVQKHLFEPFFTTKGVGKGTGLGLSVSGGLIREQGGWIAAQSEAGHGSCFSIYLPGGPTDA